MQGSGCRCHPAVAIPFVALFLHARLRNSQGEVELHLTRGVLGLFPWDVRLAARRERLRGLLRLQEEAWRDVSVEEQLRRLVEEQTAPQVRRLIARVTRSGLCMDEAAFCALAETRGDADLAVERLASAQYRDDVLLAAALHGLGALDRKTRRVYVPGTSGTAEAIERDLTITQRRSTVKVRVH